MSRSRRIATRFKNFESGRNVCRQCSAKRSSDTVAEKSSSARGPSGTPSTHSTRDPARRAGDRELGARGFDALRIRRQERGKRKAHVGQHLSPRPGIHEQRRMVDVVHDSTEQPSRPEPERGSSASNAATRAKHVPPLPDSR